MKELMQLILIAIILRTMIFSLVNADILLHIEQSTFETRVKHAETILFGRFNWAIPISNNDKLLEVYPLKQNTFEFIVYCTIKKSNAPDNVPRVIRITIEHNGTKPMIKKKRLFIYFYLEIELDMKKNSWFILFPKMTHTRNTWLIDNRNEAFDLEDDLELRIFDQFCFLKPKLPIGKKNHTIT